MKFVIVTGSRTYKNKELVFDVLDEEVMNANVDSVQDEKPEEFVVVHGACRTGADHYAHKWVMNHNREYPRDLVYECALPADWVHYGKSAGPRRNDHLKTIVKAWYELTQPKALVFHDQHETLTDLAHAWGGGTANMVKKLLMDGVGWPWDRFRFFTEDGEVR